MTRPSCFVELVLWGEHVLLAFCDPWAAVLFHLSLHVGTYGFDGEYHTASEKLEDAPNNNKQLSHQFQNTNYIDDSD